MYVENTSLTRDIDFERQYLHLHNKGFLWAVYLLATQSDSEAIYEQLYQDWSSLDTITGEDIAIVMANLPSYLPTPFENKLHRLPILKSEQQERNITDANTIFSEKLAKQLDISAVQFPCLVFVNLLNSDAKPILVPLQSNTRLYPVMKYIIFRVKELSENLKEYTHKLKQFKSIHYYDDLVKRFKNAVAAEDLYSGNIDVLLQDINYDYTAFRTLQELLYELRRRNVPLLGDSLSEDIIMKLRKVQKRYPDFERRYQYYTELQARIKEINDTIADIIQNVDVANCAQDAE